MTPEPKLRKKMRRRGEKKGKKGEREVGKRGNRRRKGAY